MAIEGLYVRPEQGPITVFRSGEPDVAEAVGVTIEAHRELGYAPDVDQATESLTKDFGAIAGLGYDGRLYVEPPKNVKTDDIIAAADGKRPDGVDETYRYKPLWIPGSEENSYTSEELDAAPEEPEARLTIFNARTDTGVDGVLHFTAMPYDEEYRDDAQKTQIEATLEAKEQFEESHPENQLHSLGHRAVAMSVLMDRIRGVDPRSDDFLLNTGWMRLPDLGRRTVGGGSIVGDVRSYRGQLKFDGTDGDAYRREGVGLSVGPKEA